MKVKLANILTPFLAVMLALLLSYLIISTSKYIRFWADDFCSSVFLQNNGYLGAQIAWWNSWTGRYSYIAFLDIVLSFGLWGIMVLPMILFVAFLIPLISSFGFIFAVIVTAIVLLNSPNLIQTFYWATGSLNYFIPFVFLNLFLLNLFKNKNKYKYLFSFVLMFVASGFSESFAVSTIVFLSFVFLLLFFVKNKDTSSIKKNIIFGLLGLFTSLFIMYLSPGNSARSLSLSHPQSFISWFKDTFYYSKWFLTSRLSIDYFLVSVATIFLLPLTLKEALKNKIEIKNTNLVLIFLTLFIPIITFTVVGLTYYAMNWEPPERVMGIVTTYIFYMLGLIGYVFWNTYNKVNMKFIFPVFISLIVLLIFFVNKYFLINKNEIKEYSLKWDRVESLLIASKGSDQVVVPNIKAVGKLDGFVENKGWVLSCIKAYYNTSEIIVK